MLKKSIIRLIAVLLCCYFFGGVRAYAEDPMYAGIKKQALKLRNTDPHVRKPAEWREAIKSLENYAIQGRNQSDAAAALMNAARMRITIADHAGEAEELTRSIEVLEMVVDDYKDSAVADDALSLLGDLYLKQEQPSKAQSFYTRLLEEHPSSDLYEYAKGKLAVIESGTSEGTIRSVKLPQGKGPIIVIDPGHGGEDFGAVGVSGLMEKDVVLDVAFELEKILRAELDARVILTRTADTFVPLQRRMEMANEAGAALFISLHTNASETKALSGFESYYLDAEGDASSKLLAERENSSDGSQVDDISFMISDLIQASKIPESRSLAESIQKNVMTHLSSKWEGIKALKVKKAPFYVLVGAHMPSVLIEMFFIDHPSDGIRLAEKEFRRNIAHGIYLGIRSYSSR